MTVCPWKMHIEIGSNSDRSEMELIAIQIKNIDLAK